MLDPADKENPDKKLNPPNWFLCKFGKSATAGGEKKEQKINEPKVSKDKLAQMLATRRHEDLKRRYRFYNAENEIFEEDDNGSGSGNEEEEDIGKNGDGEDDTRNGNEIEESQMSEIDIIATIDVANEYDQKSELRSPEKKKLRLDDPEEGEESTGSDWEEEEQEDENEQITENVDEDETNALESDLEDEGPEETEEGAMNMNGKIIIKKRRTIAEWDEDGDIELEDGSEKQIAEEGYETTAALTMTTAAMDQNPLEKLAENNDLFTNEDELSPERSERPGCDVTSDEDEQDEQQEEEDVVDQAQYRKKRKELLDDEASLSGDDVGSDPEDELAEGENEYEAEAGDLDELPDDEEIRDNLVRQYLKHQKDVDDRKLLNLQEAFFADSDLHGQDGANDRSFRLRMHDDSKVDWKKILGTFADDDEEEEQQNNNSGEGHAGIDWQERRVQMLKWRLEQQKLKASKKQPETNGDGDEEEVGHHETEKGGNAEKEGDDEGEQNMDLNGAHQRGQGSLFALGQQILLGADTEPSISKATMHTAVPTVPRRDSLLTRASCLDILVKDGKSASGGAPAPAALFLTISSSNQ